MKISHSMEQKDRSENGNINRVFTIETFYYEIFLNFKMLAHQKILKLGKIILINKFTNYFDNFFIIMINSPCIYDLYDWILMYKFKLKRGIYQPHGANYMVNIRQLYGMTFEIMITKTRPERRRRPSFQTKNPRNPKSNLSTWSTPNQKNLKIWSEIKKIKTTQNTSDQLE